MQLIQFLFVQNSLKWTPHNCCKLLVYDCLFFVHHLHRTNPVPALLKRYCSLLPTRRDDANFITGALVLAGSLYTWKRGWEAIIARVRSTLQRSKCWIQIDKWCDKLQTGTTTQNTDYKYDEFWRLIFYRFVQFLSWYLMFRCRHEKS